MNKTFLPFIMGQLRPVAISLLTALMLVGGSSFAWAQKSLPYSYGFDNNDLADEGWIMTDCNASTGIMSGTLTNPAKSGSYLFKFYGQNTTQYLISPEIENSDTGIEVSFYYNGYSINEALRKFSIGYSTTNTEKSSFDFSNNVHGVWVNSDKAWYQVTAYFPSGTKYVAIKYETNQAFYLEDFTISASSANKSPKYLSLSSTTGNTATLTWQKAINETSWNIAYSTDPDFTPGTNGFTTSSNEETVTLNSLISGATYYASVQAAPSSLWSDKLAFIPTDNALINNGSTTVGQIPINSGNLNTANNTESQFIIPSSDLTSYLNKYITKLKFYTTGSNYEFVKWGNATFEVYMGISENEKFASAELVDYNTLSKVFNEAKLSINSYEMEIVLDTPFRYTGGNLLIDVKQIAAGTKLSNLTWVANNKGYGNNYGCYKSGASTYTSYFVPKVTLYTSAINTPVTLGLNGFTTFASPRPLDLRAAKLPDGLTAYKASVDGTRVIFTQLDQTVPANTGVLLAGTAEADYNIPVAASGTTVEGNAFLVNSTGGTFSADDGFTYYGLKKAISSSDNLVFATFNPSTVAIPSNKAYLKVSNTEARQLTCVFDDEATGISATLMNSEERIVNSIYNLAGQRVAQPTKGLYIKNGRKVIVK